ncbi:hypothetical protein ACNKHK_22640 [Shigella flexneri]
MLFTSLLLGQADSANWRMAEDHGRDVAVVQMFVRFVVKQTLRAATARGNGNRRQLNGTGVIADGINPRTLVFSNYRRRCSLFRWFSRQ